LVEETESYDGTKMTRMFIYSLFGAVEKCAYLTFKGLKDYVKQPEVIIIVP